MTRRHNDFFELEIIWWTFFSSENFGTAFFLSQSSHFYIQQLYPFSFKNMPERVPFFAPVGCVMNKEMWKHNLSWSLSLFLCIKKEVFFFIQKKRTFIGYVLGRKSFLFCFFFEGSGLA